MPARNDVRWEEQLDCLKMYVARVGRFPPFYTRDCEEHKIGLWLHNQVTAYKSGRLSDDRLVMLDAVHPAWRGSCAERKAANDVLFMYATGWRANVPEGELAIDAAFHGRVLLDCLRAGIYSCEEYLRRNLGKVGSWDGCRLVFSVLFPTLDFACAYMIASVFSNGPAFAKVGRERQFQRLDVFQRLAVDARWSPDGMRRLVDSILERNLTPRECRVVRLRYGLDGSRPKTPAEIGRELFIVRERARQIEVGAVGKLRKRRDLFNL